MRALATTLLLLPALALAQTCPTHDSWPTSVWPMNLVDATAKAAELKALEDYAFTLEGKDSERKGYRTDGLIIIKHGAIIYERYGRGFDETKRHVSWSVAKSITSALIGVAVKDGALALDDSVCTTVTEWAGSPYCDITVKDVITFGTGLAWQEGYENEPYQTSSIIGMLFGVGHKDELAHIRSHKLIAAPGKAWLYSSGDATLASVIAKRALAKRHGNDAFWTQLFDRIGMERAVFEEDQKGTPQGGMLIFATPREFARFGYLFLNDGCWNGERLLPEGWVKASTTPSEAFVTGAPASETTPSGYSWWLNRAVPEQNKPKPWPDVPDDAYAALGHWGQRIFVVPSEDVVVVRTGDDREKSIPENDLLKYCLGVAR